MHVVFRVLRVLMPVLLIGAIVAIVVSVLTARPQLQSAERKVDASWNALAPQLGARYNLLAAADTQLRPIPGPVHSLVADVDTAITRWRDAQAHGSVRQQVLAANSLEAYGRRLLAVAAASPRVAGSAGAKQALAAYLADRSFTAAGSFNGTVATYERERRGPVRGVVASVMGIADIPALDTTGPTATT